MTRPRLHSTAVDGCFSLEMSLFEDIRGYFAESYKESDFRELGLPFDYPQDNLSSSKKGVMRGLHIQRRQPQGKYVRSMQGALIDFCLDLRPRSPTFKRWHAELLTENKALYLPPGTAHGFISLTEPCLIYYKCTTVYDKETDGGVAWPADMYAEATRLLDTQGVAPILSEKDKNLPSMEEWLADPRGTW